MIRGLGIEITLTYSQTLSRTGNARWTECKVKVLEFTLIRHHKRC